MELPIEQTVANNFKTGQKITLKTPNNGNIECKIFSISKGSEIIIQVELTPPISHPDEAKYWQTEWGINRKEHSGSITTEVSDNVRLRAIQLIYNLDGSYKEKDDKGLEITAIEFPQNPFPKGGKKYSRKSHKKNNKKHRKTNKRNKSNKRTTKYSK